MRNSIFVGLALLVGVASLAFATAASARSAHMTKVTKVTVAMHDPGCHWFVSGSAMNRKWSKTQTVSGPVKLLNLDEATLIVEGSTATKKLPVGHTLSLVQKGVYTITMVKQASDDNHLKLTIK